MYIVNLTEAGKKKFKEWHEKVENNVPISVEDDTQEFTPLAFVEGEMYDFEMVVTTERSMSAINTKIKELLWNEMMNYKMFDGSRLLPEWFEFKEWSMD